MSKLTENYKMGLFILSTLLLLNNCKNQKSASGIEISAKTPVTIVEPVIKDIRETIDLPAISTFLVKNVVKSSITGNVENVTVRQGDKIKKGDLLFVLKTREATAIKNAAGVDSTLGFKGEVSVFSPKDGIISTVSHQQGDFIQEGDELLSICDPESLVFILDAPFDMTAFIEKNKTLSLTLPDNKVIKGYIRGKLPEMNVQNQTVSYIVRPEISEQLPENLIASALITKKVDVGAVLLPKPALLGNETMNSFWVMKLINDSTAVRVPVTKGIETDNEVEILDPPLLPSDRIILTGNYGLPDTALIIIEK